MNQRINYEKVAQVALDYALTKSAVGNFSWQNALLGAGLGAGGGALSGLLMPGKDDEDKDDTTGSALQRGLLGGGLGGLLGGFGGNYLGSLFQNNTSSVPTSPVQRAMGRAPFNLERSIGAAAERLSGKQQPLPPLNDPRYGDPKPTRQDAKPLQRVPDSGPPKPARQDAPSQLAPRLQQLGAGNQPSVNYEGVAKALSGSGRSGTPPQGLPPRPDISFPEGGRP